MGADWQISGSVTVGVDAAPPPPLHTGCPGEGFEVDLLREVGQRAGLGFRRRAWISL